jgi:outer membrane protein TolC
VPDTTTTVSTTLWDLALLKKAMEQARNSAKDADAQVQLNVNTAFRALQDARSYLNVADLNREAARVQLRVTQDGDRQQTALLKGLLNAQAALAAASDQYRQALLNASEAQANFDKALGAGDWLSGQPHGALLSDRAGVLPFRESRGRRGTGRHTRCKCGHWVQQ